MSDVTLQWQPVMQQEQPPIYPAELIGSKYHHVLVENPTVATGNNAGAAVPVGGVLQLQPLAPVGVLPPPIAPAVELTVLELAAEDARSKAATVVKAVDLAAQEAIDAANASGNAESVPALSLAYKNAADIIIKDEVVPAAADAALKTMETGASAKPLSDMWLWLFLLAGGAAGYYMSGRKSAK